MFTKELVEKYVEELDNKCRNLKDGSGSEFPLYCDELWVSEVNDSYFVIQAIIDGDWKHEHLRFEIIAEDFFKSKEIIVDCCCDVLEEDGSDWYKGLHTIEFKKMVDYNENCEVVEL